MDKWNRQQQHEYNIILLGESGAGKSMFINSFGYYLQFNDLRSASRSKFRCQVPAKFILNDADGAEHVVEDGDDANEGTDITESRTVACKSYVYYAGHTRLRLIDSAGVGATQGPDMDEENIDDVIRFIGRYQNLHAIALVVKATETRFTTTFKYCLSKLLNQLDTAALDNLLFLLTFSDGSGYQPGDAKCLLRNILKEVEENHPELKIQLNKDNMFCVDNNCLKFIVATQQQQKSGFTFHEKDFENYDRCFENSARECLRFVQRVIGFNDERRGLIPHPVRSILNISQARKFIKLISPILDEIQLIVERNESTLNELLSQLRDQSRDANCLEELIRIQTTDIEIEELGLPQTVCKSKKCRKEVSVDLRLNLIKFHYPQVCCEGCAAEFSLRVFCQKFELFSGRCRVCGCHVTEHEKRYFRTKEVKRDVFDAKAIRNLSEKTSQKEFTRLRVQEVRAQLVDLNEEKEEIQKSSLIFAQFLRKNTAIPFIGRAETRYKQLGQFNIPDGRNRNRRNSDENAPQIVESTGNTNIEIEDIFRIKDQLFRLKLYGAKIMRVCEIDDRRNRNDEMKNRQVDIKIGLKLADKFVWVYYKHGEYKNRNKKSGGTSNRKSWTAGQNFNKSKSAIDFDGKPRFATADNRGRQAAMIVEYDGAKNRVKQTLIVQDTFEAGYPDVGLQDHTEPSNIITTPNSRKVCPPFPFPSSAKTPLLFSSELIPPYIPRELPPPPFPKQSRKITAANDVAKSSTSANSTATFQRVEFTKTPKESVEKKSAPVDKRKNITEKNDNSYNNSVYAQFFGN